MNNYSNLSSDRGKFVLTGLPITSLYVTEFPLPSISLPVTEVPNPLGDGPQPGSKIEFDDLSIEFIVDENMSNWEEVYNWMKRIAPITTQENYSYDGITHDGSIIIFNNNNNPVKQFNFKNMFPTFLGEVSFTEEDSESVVKKCSATFKYSYYDIENLV